MNRIVTKEVSTKQYEGGDAVITILTLDFTGLSDEDILEIAAQAGVVKWQTTARKKDIPTIATYKVPKPGTRGTVQLTPEALIAKYGSVDAAIAALKAVQK